MRDMKEIRTAIFYLCIFIVLPVFFFRALEMGSLFKEITFGGINFNIMPYVVIFMLWFLSIPLAIYYSVRASGYFEMLKKERLIEWKYKRDFWVPFVWREVVFRVKDDLKFYLMYVIFPVFIAFIITLVNDKMEIAQATLATVISLLIFWIIFKNILFIIDNMIFSDGYVIGTRGGLSFNGEYHYWHKSPRRILDVEIETGLIYIEYLISASPHRRWETKTIRIPIPEDKMDEAKYYMQELSKTGDMSLDIRG